MSSCFIVFFSVWLKGLYVSTANLRILMTGYHEARSQSLRSVYVYFFIATNEIKTCLVW